MHGRLVIHQKGSPFLWISEAGCIVKLIESMSAALSHYQKKEMIYMYGDIALRYCITIDTIADLKDERQSIPLA